MSTIDTEVLRFGSWLLLDDATGVVHNGNALAQDARGCIWIGSRFGGLSCFDGQEVTRHTHEHGCPVEGVRTIACDSRGWVWVVTASGGLVRYDGSEFSVMFAAGDGGSC